MPSCPTSKQEWDIAASKKNCEKLAAKALCNTSEKPYFYHCVINGFRNQTLEVCAPRKIIFGNLVYEIFYSCEFWCKKQLKQLRMWFFKNNLILFIVIWLFKDIVQNSMLPEELSNVMLRPNATVHFQNVTSPTILQRLTNVLLEKNQIQDYKRIMLFPQNPEN